MRRSAIDTFSTFENTGTCWGNGGCILISLIYCDVDFLYSSVQALCEKDKKSESSTERLFELHSRVFSVFFYSCPHSTFGAYLVHRTRSDYRSKHTMTYHGALYINMSVSYDGRDRGTW